MGTKVGLVDSVSATIACARPGMMLDAFAGMGSVARAVGSSRSVWHNDVQRFAFLVGKRAFTTGRPLPHPQKLVGLVECIFEDYASSLESFYVEALIEEASRISACSYRAYHRAAKMSHKLISNAKCGKRYSYFSNTFSTTYFSLNQCIEIDSLRYALDKAQEQHLISMSEWEWGLIALGRACLKTANTTGHFAQPLRPSEGNYRRVQKQAKKSIWAEWLVSAAMLKPSGTAAWRKNNKASQIDSLALLESGKTKDCVSVVYLDPPYTDDQYSRYYHLWETLILYDKPRYTGSGLYRTDRFTTPFSIKSKVAASFDRMLSAASRSGHDVVLSYPSNGLLYDAGYDPLTMLKSKYRRAELVKEIGHMHSTFGASKGLSKSVVTEQIFLAQQ